MEGTAEYLRNLSFHDLEVSQTYKDIEIGFRFSEERDSLQIPISYSVYLRVKSLPGKDLFETATNTAASFSPVPIHKQQSQTENDTESKTEGRKELANVMKYYQSIQKVSTAGLDVLLNARRKKDNRYHVLTRKVWTPKGKLVYSLYAPVDPKEFRMYEIAFERPINTEVLQLISLNTPVDTRISIIIGLLVKYVSLVPCSGTLTQKMIKIIINNLPSGQDFAIAKEFIMTIAPPVQSSPRFARSPRNLFRGSPRNSPRNSPKMVISPGSSRLNPGSVASFYSVLGDKK